MGSTVNRKKKKAIYHSYVSIPKDNVNTCIQETLKMHLYEQLISVKAKGRSSEALA